MLIVIQGMAAKLGIATGKLLAVNIRENFSPPVSAFLGLTIVLEVFLIVSNLFDG